MYQKEKKIRQQDRADETHDSWLQIKINTYHSHKYKNMQLKQEHQRPLIS